ncbi:MAG: PqqD family peptide modification chaperone [Crocinitomicaceae bacterium]|nr:PqqD family peptide modification chaperone [Crocinitomicaceae bacterium]
MKTYHRNQNTVASKLHEELVMIDIDLGKYFSLNPVASEIWEIIETPKGCEEIVAELMEIYEIEKDACSTQVKSFLQELKGMKLISIVEGK